MQFPIPARYPEYLVAAVLIILAPGPSVLFAIARAIAWGRATAIATVAGNALGMFSLSILIAFGLGPISKRTCLYLRSNLGWVVFNLSWNRCAKAFKSSC